MRSQPRLLCAIKDHDCALSLLRYEIVLFCTIGVETTCNTVEPVLSTVILILFLTSLLRNEIFVLCGGENEKKKHSSS